MYQCIEIIQAVGALLEIAAAIASLAATRIDRHNSRHEPAAKKE
jgi:hypothetical protein